MFILLVIPISVSSQEPKPLIVVFAPSTEGNTYWPQAFEIMEAVAADLDLDLRTFAFDVADRYAKVDEGIDILRSLPRIDGAVFSVAFGQTAPLLAVAEELGFPVMIQGPLFERDLARVGDAPRQRYSRWIATFREDESEKGRRLARVLVREARRQGSADSDGPVTIAGINGDPTWYGSYERASGLEQAVAADPRVVLQQIVPSEWTEAEGHLLARGLLARYPDLDALWAASDQLAIGAARAARDFGRTVGTDIVVGGLDLSRRGLEAVASGELTASVASPLFIWAEVLIYLYDYIAGYDFAPQVGTEIVFAPREGIGPTVGEIRGLYRDVSRIDYAALSRAHPDSQWSSDHGYRFPWTATEEPR